MTTPSDRPVRIVVARHPETQANVARRFVGRGDTPYTQLGMKQADELVVSLSGFGPDAVVSSPLRRCLEVAERIAESSAAPLTVLNELAEMDFGQAEGLTYAEASRLGIDMDLLGGPREDEPFAGGETWTAFETRVRAGYEAVLAAGERVAVVTHSGVVRSVLTIALALPEEAAWRFAVSPGSVTLLTAAEGYAVLEGFGLPPEGCP